MGTSQSHKLLKSPAWSNAKKTMTGVALNPTPSNIGKFMRAFSDAVSSSSPQHFGNRGGAILGNFLDLVNSTKLNAEKFLGIPIQEFEGKSKDEILIEIYDKLVEINPSNPDDIAAQAALDVLLSEIFSQSEDIKDIRNALRNATDEDLERWIIEFEITYVLEYNAELFQSHIFSKDKNPQEVFRNIKSYLRQEISDKFSDSNSKPLSFFLSNKEEIANLTEKILKIWKQE